MIAFRGPHECDGQGYAWTAPKTFDDMEQRAPEGRPSIGLPQGSLLATAAAQFVAALENTIKHRMNLLKVKVHPGGTLKDLEEWLDAIFPSLRGEFKL